LKHILPQCSKARAESEQLGTLRSLRRKLYEYLRRYREQLKKKTLDSSIASQLEALERVMDLIYRYPLKAAAKEAIRRQLKLGIVEKLLEKLARVHAKHFTAKTPATKQECREEDKKLRAQMNECLKTDGWDDRTAHLLANWDPYDQNASAPFFDPEWMFGLSTGFDIVLGNPPYIQLQKSYDQNSIYADLYKDQKYKKCADLYKDQNHKLQKSQYADLYEEQNYKSFDREGDIYCLFYERGVELLREEGILAYITSNKWMRTGYGENYASTSPHTPIPCC